MQADGGGGVNLFSAELLPVIRFAGDAVAIAVHMFAVAGIAAIERSLASGAHFVAAAVSDRLFDSVPRRYFFLCDCGQVIDAENGDQGAKSAIYDFLTRMCLKIGMTTKANWMFMPGQQWFLPARKRWARWQDYVNGMAITAGFVKARCVLAASPISAKLRPSSICSHYPKVAIGRWTIWRFAISAVTGTSKTLIARTKRRCVVVGDGARVLALACGEQNAKAQRRKVSAFRRHAELVSASYF